MTSALDNSEVFSVDECYYVVVRILSAMGILMDALCLIFMRAQGGSVDVDFISVVFASNAVLLIFIILFLVSWFSGRKEKVFNYEKRLVLKKRLTTAANCIVVVAAICFLVEAYYSYALLSWVSILFTVIVLAIPLIEMVIDRYCICDSDVLYRKFESGKPFSFYVGFPADSCVRSFNVFLKFIFMDTLFILFSVAFGLGYHGNAEFTIVTTIVLSICFIVSSFSRMFGVKDSCTIGSLMLLQFITYAFSLNASCNFKFADPGVALFLFITIAAASGWSVMQFYMGNYPKLKYSGVLEKTANRVVVRMKDGSEFDSATKFFYPIFYDKDVVLLFED